MVNSDYNQFLYAKKLYTQRRYDKALEIFERLQRIYPANSSVKFEYARALIKTGTFISYGETILYNFYYNYGGTKYEIAALELARLELERCNYNKAEKYLEPLLKCQNSNRVIFELAKINQLKGNYKIAIDYLKQLISINYNLPITYLYLINTYYKIGAYQNAYDCLNYIIDNNIEIRLEAKDAKKLNLLLKYKLGLLSKEELLSNDNYYSLIQNISYSKDEALEHISQHQNPNQIGSTHAEINKIPFLSEIDINELYDACLLKLEDAPIYGITSADEYIVRFDKPIARVNFEYIHTVSVITICNTKNIITIYPNARVEKLLKPKDNNKMKIKK